MSSFPASAGSMKSKLSQGRDGNDLDGTWKKIEASIELARKSGKLELTEMGLEEVPSGAFDLKETVRLVRLFENQISELPAAIQNWKAIQQLRINNNKLKELPAEIGKLRTLSLLIVNDNRLIGIPATIQGCKLLQVLDCRNNCIKRLPVEIGFLSNMHDLQFEGNPLEFPHRFVAKSGKAAVMKYFKRYTEARKTGRLDLTKCSLSDIPPEVDYVGQQLVELDVSDIRPAAGLNIPIVLARCVNLITVRFSPDQLIAFPPPIVCTKGLVEILNFLKRYDTANTSGALDLSGLGLSEIPAKTFDEKYVQIARLTQLVISRNEITSIPTAIAVIENLNSLDISFNRMDSIPGNIAKLKNLTSLDFSGNSITIVADLVSRLLVLKILKARKNLILDVSASLRGLQSIEEFDVGENKLAMLPLCILTWTNLRVLLADHNELADVPADIDNLQNLEWLDLSSNLMVDFPKTLGRLLCLKVLALNNNNMAAIPMEIGDLSNLERLELQDCKELFCLPDSISNITRPSVPLARGIPYLKHLVLDTRYMLSPPSSSIDRGIAEIFEFLNFMSLAKNSGFFFYAGRGLSEVPFTICMLSNLVELGLSHNLLNEESFPPPFSRLGNLRVLLLDHNRLESIPGPVLRLTTLSSIALAENPLKTLPPNMHVLVNLQTLDIGFPGPELVFPPKEISTKGGAAVVNFVRCFGMVLTEGRMELARLSLKCLPAEVSFLASQILRLSVAHNRLSSLPPKIKELYNLRTLRLHDNLLDNLPEETGALTSLTELDLEGNRLESCPSILSSLASMTLINLARNDMVECPLPICGMTQLVELYLDHNRINALPNRIGRCAQLIHLSVSHNELTKLPASVRDLTCLTYVNLAHNRLTIVPSDIGLLRSLEILELAGNDLASPPAQIVEKGTWAVARYLEKIQQMFVTGQVNLDDCNLTTIPLDVLSYDAVHTLILTNNALKTVPDGIGRLRHLKSLDLSFNCLEDLPAALGNCVALEDLNLSRNPITTLPWDLGKLSNLKSLDLDHELMVSPPEAVSRRGAKEVVRFLNALTSAELHHRAPLSGFDLKEIPKEVLRMVNLRELRVGKNRLETIPASIARHTNLTVLVLDENPRLRDLPKTMRTMLTLTDISLAGNGLRTISDEVFRLTNLTSLCFARNQLDGLGSLIGKLCFMQVLDLSFNLLWTLPWPAILNMHSLHTLNLQGNPVTYVSASIAQVTTLTSINLSDTKLPSLPADIIDLHNLKVLNLENVNIQGPAIPIVAKGLSAIRSFLSSIRAARYTMELELSELECEGGSSSGLAPYQLFSVLQHLQICRSNLLYIPPPVLEFSLLTSLDLSQNQIKQLPNSIGGSFPFLERFTATDNKLAELPKGLGLLTSLKELLLTKNALETLPSTIANCTGLTCLDLMDNQVTYLPKEARVLTNLTHLEMVFRCLTDFHNLDLSWNMWGKPPADITLQGGKVVKKFYHELLRVSGTSEEVLDRLQGAQGTLNLSKFGLMRMPAQIFEKNLFSHLVTLDLSYNKIDSLSPEISRLSKLQLVNLTECPIVHLTPSLGALSTDLLVETAQIGNVPELWLERGKTGILQYLKKAFLEINSGCMDFTGCGLRSLARDMSDLLLIKELFLANNLFTRLPASIGLLTNLTSLRAQHNQMCCIPREISLLTGLKCLSVQGNRIAIVPTELGLLTNITDLGFDSQTFLSLPAEVCAAGSDRILKFLGLLEKSRGQQKMVRPQPGLAAGQSFDLYVKDQVFSILVPRGYNAKSRESFATYLPDVPQAERARLVADGFEFMNSTGVGLVLDLRNLGLRELQLIAVPGSALDSAQEGILSTSDAVSGAASGAARSRTQKAAGAQYEVTSEGVLTMKRSSPEPKAMISLPSIPTTGNGLRALIGDQVRKVMDKVGFEEEEILMDLPTKRYDTEDLIIAWMFDHSIQTVFPLPIGKTSALTELRLDDNKIPSIPSSIGTLSNLTLLSARNNSIESVSWRLRYLIYLREIDFTSNRIVELPPKLGRCDRLRVLKLTSNYIRHLPVSVGRLTMLQVLDLDDNPIVALPHEIGGVDDDENKDIKGLLSIEKIYLRECEMLRHLPSKMYRLTQLQLLDLSGSYGLLTPPPEVHEDGITAIFAYLQEVYTAEQSMSMTLTGHNLLQVPVVLAEINSHLNEKQGKYIGMPNLRMLNLSKNQISKIPSYMNVLTNLRTLNLDYNRIRRLPPVIGNFTRLQVLSIQHNEITSFCDEISQLLSIRFIHADFNKIENVCDGFMRLSTLFELSLENNSLRLVPESILQLSELKALRLSCNKISRVPDNVMGMVGLEQLLMRDNQLKTLPDSLGSMSMLKELDIADNQIELLPLGLGKLTALTKLETRRNCILRPSKSTQAKGPKAVIEYLQRVERAIQLKLLDLENFGLTAFPLDVITMDSLTELNISGNEVSIIPEEILALSRVVTLRLAANNIQNLSVVVGRLSTLETLDLHRNRLQNLPTTLQLLKSLLHIDLSENKFELFPPVLETLTQMEYLNMTDNLLTRMPYWIGSFSRANAILFGGNQLCTMPNSIGALGPIVLNTLNLSNNGLIKVPSAICSVATIRSLTLSGNVLDELPSALGRLAALEELWIDNNKISRLPPTFPFWVNLTTLFAHNNCFKTVPAKVVELLQLRVLTLSGNAIAVLPDMTLLTNLEELWLDGNKLAAIPYFEKLPKLKSFSCNDNPLIESHAVRAEKLMDLYRDAEVERRLASAAGKRNISSVANDNVAADGPIVIRELSESKMVEVEVDALQEQLKAAWAQDNLELASEIQDKLDRLLAGDQADHAGRPSSAVHDMLLSVSVLSCSRLTFGKLQDRQINPYVVLEIGGEQRKTKAQSKTSAPIFRESFTFDLKQQRESELQLNIRVMHKNTFTKDAPLASAAVDHQIIRIGAEGEHEIALRSDSEQGLLDAGVIRLAIRLEPVAS